MKKLLLAFIIFFPVSLFAGTYDDLAEELLKKIPAKEKTKIIAVMPLSSDERFSSDARIATEELTKALINAGAEVSERSQIDKILKEQELQQAGVLSNETAGEVAQGLGAKYVVLGTVVEINKYDEKDNIGLKINVRLVSSSNYKVLAVAIGEASAGDASGRYRRKAPRKAAEYPQFLEIFGGATHYKYNGEINQDMKTGFSAGARLYQETKGFYTNGWELLYSNQKFDDNDLFKKFEVYQFSWIPTIRIPLWVYIPALPDYTSIQLGYAFGAGVSYLSYFDDENKENHIRNYGICSSAILGLRLGISDSVSFFADVRYTPSRINGFVRLADLTDFTKDGVQTREITGPSAYFGISLAP